MKKRVFSAFLTLIMLLTLVPAGAVTVFAATDVPSGYTKVEYVESYGDGYIDTGWATADATESYAYEITFAPSETKPAANGTIFGAWSNISGVGGRIGMIALRAKGTTRVVFGSVSAANSTTYWTTTTDKQTARVEVDVAANTYEVTSSDVSVQKGTGSISGSSLCEYSAYLFMTNRANAAVSGEATAAKAYGLKCWTDGVLVRDFVPVVENASGVAGLYDLVNGKFHGAAGGVGVYGPEGPAETIVTFTTPSDVTLQVSEGFAVGENENSSSTPISIMTKTSEVTEGDTTTHTYTLPVGSYRFLSMSKDGPDNDKYYNWDKNFIVTYADVLAGGKTIDADPGLLAGTGWEQKRKQASYYVRQFTDEVLNNVEISGVREDVRAKYPHVFTTPSFASTKARHEFTTHEEIRSFLTERDAANAKMYVYELGKGKDNMEVWVAFFTTTDLTGKTWQEAAQAVRNNGKPTVQAQAQVHGDEQSGTEGALALINTLCNDSTWADAALSEVNVVVLPRMNPYGSKIYQYTSVKDSDGSINFNRDYMQLKEVETNMLLALYNELHPEVVIDMHEFRPITQSTSGALPDTKMAVTDSLNLPAGLIDLAYDLVDYETQELIKDGIRLGYYRDGATDTSPVNAKEYYSQRGSIGVLFEIPGQRKGKQQWDRRILSQFLGVKHIIDFVAADADNFKASVAAARAEMAEYGKTFDENKQFVTHHVAGDKITFAAPTFNLTDGTVKDANATSSVSKYNKADQSRAIPMGYVIPKSAANIDVVLALAAKHGITYSEIGADETMELRQYKNYYRRNNTAETAVEEGVELGEATLMRFESGAYFFPVAQESSVVLMLLMEPDIRDASKNEEEWHKSSLVQQAKLSAEDIYRCENIVEHVLTYVPAKPASCATDGNTEHYICACGAGFAANEHKNALEQDSWIIPATGHNFVQQMVGSEAQFICENNCGEANVSLNKVLAACDGVGGTVKVFGDITTASMVVPAGATLDLDGHKLTAENLTVNEGGKIMNGSLSVSSTATVNLGSNGGWIPMWSGENGNYDVYKLYAAEIKAGKNVISTNEGTKYSFGYKMTENAGEASPYTAAIAAGEKVRFGVALTLDGNAVDYSFSSASIAKMEGINAAASSDEFFKVNLNLVGVNNDLTKVRVAPVVKVSKLGFRYVGEATGEGSGEYVARINAQGYYTVEDAVAAAAATNETTYIKLVDDVQFKRPTTIKLNGKTHFVLPARTNITISGPVTFDGQSGTGLQADGLLMRVYGESSLVVKDGVTFRNYNNIRNAEDNFTYGGIFRIESTCNLTLDGVTVENCGGGVRGAVYITGSPKVDIRNSTFRSNKANRQYGGAIAIYGANSVNVENCVFDGNRASSYGGAIGVYDSEAAVTLKNNTFTDNVCSASYYGGAIGVSSGYSGELSIIGCEFSGNSIDDIGKAGGTVILEGAIKGLEKITLKPYEAIAVGETLSLDETASVSVNGSTTLTGGEINAGKYITEDGMRDSLPAYIAAVGDKRYETLTAALEATKNATSATVIELYGNETVTTATTATLGANVQIKVTSDSIISGPLTIDGASKTQASAVPVVVDGVTLTLNGVTLQNIVSTFTEESNYHGVIRVQGNGTLNMENANLIKCTAPYGMIGGAAGSTFNIKNSSVSNNKSTVGSGGALFLVGVTLNAENSTFSGNTSAARSGAIHVGNTSAKVTLTNCTFAGNTAGTTGGAICIYAANKNNVLTGCTFTNNTAGKQGGAICIYAAASVVIDGVTMSGNKATTSSTASNNDISYMKGTLELKGAIDMDYIALNSGLLITLDAPASFAGKITVSGPKSGAATFAGSKVAEYYTNFTHKTTTLTFDSTGKCVAK